MSGMDPWGFTAEQVAHVCHEANRVVQRIVGDPVSPPWDEAPDWMQQSAITGVATAQGGTATPEELHAAWCREREAAGWTHGPVKDEQARTHPCLVPYDQLPPAQRAKDALFRAVVAGLDG